MTSRAEWPSGIIMRIVNFFLENDLKEASLLWVYRTCVAFVSSQLCRIRYLNFCQAPWQRLREKWSCTVMARTYEPSRDRKWAKPLLGSESSLLFFVFFNSSSQQLTRVPRSEINLATLLSHSGRFLQHELSRISWGWVSYAVVSLYYFSTLSWEHHMTWHQSRTKWLLKQTPLWLLLKQAPLALADNL